MSSGFRLRIPGLTSPPSILVVRIEPFSCICFRRFSVPQVCCSGGFGVLIRHSRPLADSPEFCLVSNYFSYVSKLRSRRYQPLQADGGHKKVLFSYPDIYAR